MSLAGLTRKDWAAMPLAASLAECRDLARRLDLKFTGTIVSHIYAGEAFRVARFRDRAGAEFVLIPGDHVALGFDASAFVASKAQRASFESSAEDCGFPALEQFLAEQSTIARTASLAPLLMEVTAREAGMNPIDRDHPEWDALVEEFEGSRQEYGTRMLHMAGFEIRALDDGGHAIAFQSDVTHEALAAELKAEGYRMPASDEWEYACGGGRKSLFRWGDDCPCDFYPDDASVEDRLAKRAWALSGGGLAYQPGVPSWTMHTSPNAFALNIASNPYHMDLVADGGHVRGGDGGASICGGTGFFAAWSTLATAYTPPSDALRPGGRLNGTYYRVRRCISVDH